MRYTVVYSYRNLERHEVVDLKQAKYLDLTLRYLNFKTLHSPLMASSTSVLLISRQNAMDLLQSHGGTAFLCHTSEEKDTAVRCNEMHYLPLHLCEKSETDATHNSEHTLGP
jgi:hypothetical protein